MAGFFDRMKQSLGYQPPPEEPQNTSLLGQIQSNVSEATTLTTQQRFWGFGASVLITAICWGLVRPAKFTHFLHPQGRTRAKRLSLSASAAEI